MYREVREGRASMRDPAEVTLRSTNLILILILVLFQSGLRFSDSDSGSQTRTQTQDPGYSDSDSGSRILGLRLRNPGSGLISRKDSAGADANALLVS